MSEQDKCGWIATRIFILFLYDNVSVEIVRIIKKNQEEILTFTSLHRDYVMVLRDSVHYILVSYWYFTGSCEAHNTFDFNWGLLAFIFNME